VRNTWVTCPLVRNTGEKSPTIPHRLSHESKASCKRGARGWARGRLASWWGKSLPRRRSVAGLRGRSATLGLRTAQTPTGGSSEEFSAMGATLTEQRRVQEEGLRIVNCFSRGREWTVPEESAPANYVPAAAVIRRGRALSGVTGRKAHAGGRVSLGLQLPAQLGERLEDCRT
jgi:hypothetical protein